jgi:hypothetical protein
MIQIEKELKHRESDLNSGNDCKSQSDFQKIKHATKTTTKSAVKRQTMNDTFTSDAWKKLS